MIDAFVKLAEKAEQNDIAFHHKWMEWHKNQIRVRSTPYPEHYTPDIFPDDQGYTPEPVPEDIILGREEFRVIMRDPGTINFGIGVALISNLANDPNKGFIGQLFGINIYYNRELP